MTDLKGMIQAHPECLSNRARFKSFLMDLYPNDKRLVNILLAIVECGIGKRMQSLSVLGKKEMELFTQRLDSEYGISPRYAEQAISFWAKTYGINIALEEFRATERTNRILFPAAQAAKFQNIQDDDVSRFLVSERDGRYYIAGYNGHGEENLLVPSVIDGKQIFGIEQGVFSRQEEVKSIVISEGIQLIGANAFFGCMMLESIVIPDSVFAIGEAALSLCVRLPSISFPDSMKRIRKSICAYCKRLESVKLPANLQSIEESAFQGCRLLKEIHIPSGTRSIGAKAFANCENLVAAFIPPSVTTFEVQGVIHTPFQDETHPWPSGSLTIFGEMWSNAMSLAKKNDIKFRTYHF